MARRLSDSEGLYKSIAVFLAGVVVSGVCAWFLGPKNAVTRDELDHMMPGIIAQFSPYTTDQKNISNQLQSLSDRQAREEAAIHQIEVDVARISMKVGVSAAPSSEFSQQK